jgi:(p)ppGpp synthase/HD superfamily hydrolase
LTLPSTTTTPLLTRRFDEALLYASKMHRTQLRKDTAIPYFSHPLGVASLVLEHGGNEDEAIAALLHDVVEDCGGEPRLVEIHSQFGPAVADIVKGCTDGKPGEERIAATWLQRKVAYVEHLGSASPSVRLVSFCDKLHNARAILTDYVVIGDELWRRFNAGKENQMKYYRSLADASKGRVPQRVSDTLEQVVSEIERRAARP